MESPFLEEFKGPMDVALGDTVAMAVLDCSQRSFPTKTIPQFHDQDDASAVYRHLQSLPATTQPSCAKLHLTGSMMNPSHSKGNMSKCSTPCNFTVGHFIDNAGFLFLFALLQYQEATENKQSYKVKLE